MDIQAAQARKRTSEPQASVWATAGSMRRLPVVQAQVGGMPTSSSATLMTGFGCERQSGYAVRVLSAARRIGGDATLRREPSGDIRPAILTPIELGAVCFPPEDT